MYICLPFDSLLNHRREISHKFIIILYDIERSSKFIIDSYINLYLKSPLELRLSLHRWSNPIEALEKIL